MKFDTDDFRVHQGKSLKIGKRPTSVKPLYSSKDECAALLKERVEAIAKLQNMLYASGSHALLLIFQAMDAAGKDSAIKHVLSGINPQGCQVTSFKQPSLTELKHDFLWRTTQCLPERGRIGVFNRSYYEEVLVVRVHPDYLVGQGIDLKASQADEFWEHRYASIRHHEKHLHRNNTRVIKFYLNVSKDEQRKRFLARIDDPSKNFKFSAADLSERKLWDHYMSAYEQALAATSTDDCPWYTIPADDKENAHLIIAQIVLETLKATKPAFPTLDKKAKIEMEKLRETLGKD
jgi:PPK2 family polyphosphate:nucleotide phosphotransferase